MWKRFWGCGYFQGLIFVCLQWAGFVQACNMIYMASKATPARWACLDNGGEAIGAVENGTRSDEELQCSIINSPTGCKNFTWTGDFYSIVRAPCPRVPSGQTVVPGG